MSVKLLGTGGNELAIDATSNAAHVSLYDQYGNILNYRAGDAVNSAGASGIVSMGVNDRNAVPLRVDRSGALALNRHTPLLMDAFEGATLNNIRYLITSTTMAAAQATISGMLFNSASITTINTGYMIQSARRYLKTSKVPLAFRARARLNMQNNSVMELGFADATTAIGANTTGAYWQVTSAGAVIPVVTFNGGDVTGTDIRSSLNTSNYYTWTVYCDDDYVMFTCQDSSTGLLISKQVIQIAITAPRLFSQTAVPAMVRLYNTAVAPAAAPQLILMDLYAFVMDQDRQQPWAHALAGQDRGFLSRFDTAAQLPTWANSAEPASLTLSNTAAGMATLGGKFQFAAVVGAATDYAIVGYQVPAGANLFVTGIAIDVWNTGAAVATTPTLMTWGVAAGSTAVSLATATVMRTGLGANSLPIATVVGGLADRRISKSFQTPLFCAANRFFHVILRMPVATATASQVVAGMINIEAYFD